MTMQNRKRRQREDANPSAHRPVVRTAVESGRAVRRWRLALLIAALTLLALAIPRGLLGADAAVLEAEARRVAVLERICPPTVAIFAPGGSGGGSGVLVSPDGYTVTNYHVIEGLGGFMKCGLNDGNVYDAVLVGIDPTGDVALIKLLGRDDFPAAEIGNSDDVRQGDWAYAIGNPFLLATDFQPTVSYGIVSGVHRYQYPAGTFLEYTDCIQVDASINPGNSGGPLFSDDGKLIGINGRASFEKRGRVNSGAGYAISINQVVNFLDHLKSGRIVDHATLGATVIGGNDGAVYVSNILEQSEAYRRGLRSGDELVSFAGRPMRSVNQFKNVLGIYPKGWTVPIVYRRDGQKHELHVRLRALHRQAELLGQEDAEGTPEPGPEPRPEQPEEEERPQMPIPGHKAKSKPPAEYAHMFEARSGYANWWFNLQHRDRVMTGIRQLGDFGGYGGTWELRGETGDAKPVVFKLNDRAAASEIDGVAALQRADQPFGDQPPGSGGLLAALFQLRQLLRDPAAYFTEFYYLGSEPLDGGEQRVDVLITTKGTVTSRWYFSREDGRLMGWDTTLEEDVDECRIRIDSFRDFSSVRLPERMSVSHGTEPLIQVQLQQAVLQ